MTLSPAGTERRRAMLGMLQGEVARRRRRRAAARWSLASSSVLAIALVLAWRAAPGPGRSAAPDLSSGPGKSARVAEGAFERLPLTCLNATLEIVHDEPGVAGRYLLRDGPPAKIVILSDEDLLRELESLDRPAGLIRTAGGLILTANVVDPLWDGSPGGIRG